MNKKRNTIAGYTLLEMLLVMAIVVVLGAFGVGGFIGVRETMVAKENVEILQQDIRSARLNSMLLEKGSDENWLYGVGIDLESLNSDGEYVFFKWCSPFEDFGDELTKSELPGWDSSYEIGYNTGRTSPFDPYDPVRIDDPRDNFTDIERPPLYFNIEELFKRLNIFSPYPVMAINTEIPPYPIQDEVLYQVVPNGYVPSNLSTSSTCQDGVTTRIEVNGSDLGGVIDVDPDQIKILGSARHLVFEALTGRAFLYDANGRPVNYSGMGTMVNNTPMDVVLTRKRSSKFDVISVYPLSGTVVHHVYSSSDINDSCTPDSECLIFNGHRYPRFGIDDEINSYRD